MTGINKFFLYRVLALICCCFTACKNNTDPVNLSGAEVEINIERFGHELFNVDLDSIPAHVLYLSEKYGDFFTKYNQHVIQIGDENSRNYPAYLTSFLTDYTMNQVYEKCKEVFPDVEMTEKKLTDAFKRFKYYYPDKSVPEIYTMISGFNQSVVVGRNYIGIGLDKYLGRDCMFYKQLNWPRYKVMKMYKEKIPSDCIRAWALTEYEYNDSINNVVNNMIYHGKIIYYTKTMMPHEHDTLIMGFTNEQLEWCKKNEKRMWTYLIEHNILYNTDYMTITKYIHDGPYTPGFPRESPGRAALWIGWRIVDEYMGRHSEVTLKELMKEEDTKKILNGSRYDP